MNNNHNNENENESENENENESENESKNENENVIRELSDDLDKIIDKSKSFEEQIKLLRKVEEVYYYTEDYDNKELKLKIFKVKLAQFSNIIDEGLLVSIFGDTLEALASKLINITDKKNIKQLLRISRKIK